MKDPPGARRISVTLPLEDYVRLVRVAGNPAAVSSLVVRLIRAHLDHGEHTRAALRARKAQGVQLGQRPLQGDAVIRAQQLRREGKTLRDIAQILTEEAYATKRGGRWGPGNVSLLLQRAAREETS